MSEMEERIERMVQAKLDKHLAVFDEINGAMEAQLYENAKTAAALKATVATMLAIAQQSGLDAKALFETAQALEQEGIAKAMEDLEKRNPELAARVDRRPLYDGESLWPDA